MTSRLARLSVAAVLLAGLAPRPAGAALPAQQLEDAFVETIAAAKPAVVNIKVTQEHKVRVAPQFYFGDPEEMFEHFFYGTPPRRRGPETYRYRTEGTGSGFVIDPSGLVLTNEHVVRGADKIEITLYRPGQSDLKLPGRVVGKDPSLDLAVVRIEAKGPFPALKLGDSSKVRVGQWVIAIGSPFELQQTVTAGILSAVRQSVTIEDRVYPNLLQTDAAINRGNSGGPLINIRGEVIGINTAIYSPAGVFAGIGFAIPADEARATLGLLEQGKTIKRGWLGVGLMPVDDVIRQRFGLPEAAGALVNKIFKGSPAEKAGLKRGDVIVQVNGKKVEKVEDLMGAAALSAPGTTLELKALRQGRPQAFSLRLAERPAWAAEGQTPPEQEEEGAPEEETPAAPEPETRAPQPQGRAFVWEGVEFVEAKDGVQVRGVDRTSKLAGYLREGDVVQGLNQQPIRDAKELEKAAKGAKLSEGVVFDVLRDGRPLYVSVQSS